MQKYTKNQTIKKIIPINGIEFIVTIKQIDAELFQIQKMVCTYYDIMSMPSIDQLDCISKVKNLIIEKASEWFAQPIIDTISGIGRACADQDREGFEHDCALFFHAENQHS
jgi:hypothetical protein